MERETTKRHVRVAVAQLEYLPAFGDADREALRDPLWKLEREVSSLLPEGSGGVVPARARDAYKPLQLRVRKAYLEQLRRRLDPIVDACRAWGVQLLVLPEYSVPAWLLEPLAQRAGEMVVVAGSHSVTREILKDGVYERLGWSERVEALTSVSPVLHGGRLIGLVSKIHPAKPELGRMEPGKTWAPIELPEGLVAGSLGVLICLDFLARRSPRYRELVAAPLEGCRLVAAPAMTPAHSRDEFWGRGREDARRAHCPVLHANYAPWGGSAIFVDEGRPEDLRLFPEHGGYLEPGEEGVLVADIDLGMERPGDSTSYALTPPIIPYAAASLVYRGTEPQYAEWAEALQSVIDLAGPDDIELLEKVTEFVHATPPPVPARESARGRRLSRLLQEIDDVSSVERVRRLTREVLLPEEALPLHALKATLARGAADEVGRWVSELDEGAFGPVRGTLREAWTLVEKAAAGWSEGARRAADEVSREVRGGPAPVPQQALMQELAVSKGEKTRLLEALTAFGDVVKRRFDEKSELAAEHFTAGEYEEARAIWEGMLEETEKLLAEGKAVASTSLREWATLLRLNLAGTAINLQELERAREILKAIEVEDLSMDGRLGLIPALAAVGECERARGLMPVDDGPGVEPETLTEARQALMLAEGEVPADLLPNMVLQVRAAGLLLQRNDLTGAAEHALVALHHGESSPHVMAACASLLELALTLTIWEEPPTARLIPPERRGALVSVLADLFAALEEHPPPKVVARTVDTHQQRFRELCMVPRSVSEIAEGHPDPADDEVVGALKLARRHGDFEEALKTLPKTDHPWRGRLRRVQIIAAVGRYDLALAEILALVEEFPGREPLEQLAARLLWREGRLQDARMHAERAFAALPGRLQRLLLVELLVAVGEAEQASALLRPLLERSAPREPDLLRSIVHVAEATQRPAEVIEAMREYVALRPGDAQARVQLAQFLQREHHPGEAAEEAWRAFQDHHERLGRDEIHVCGYLQRLGGLSRAEQVRRIEDITACLRQRFPGDAGAAVYRYQLLSSLGEVPEGVYPGDMELMIKHGYARRHDSPAAMGELIDQQRQQTILIEQLVASGLLPTATACELATHVGVSNPLACVIVWSVRMSRRAAVNHCAPVELFDLPPPIDLRGASLLLSDLELLLMKVLDLTGPLRDALQPAGTILLFHHVAGRIHRDASQLQISSRAEQLQRIEAWLRRLEEIHPIATDQADIKPVSPLALVRWMVGEQVLTEAQGHAIQAHLQPEDIQESQGSIPRLMVLDGPLLRALLLAESLDPVLDCFEGHLIISPEALQNLRHERDVKRDIIDAAALADSIHQYLAEGREAGWIRLLPHRARTLPLAQEPSDDDVRRKIHEPLLEAVAYQELLVERPELWRVNADFYQSNALHAPFVFTQLPWESHEAYVELVKRLAPAAERTMTLPTLVRLLFPDHREADERLIRLARLGFPDALGPGELLRLERRYGGLDRGEPARLLERQEWMAVAPVHPGSDLVRLRLSGAYARTIIDALLEDIDAGDRAKRSVAEKQALIRALLSRQEAIGLATDSVALEQTLKFLALETTYVARLAWKEEGDGLIPDEEGPVGMLWRTVQDWCGADGHRRAAYGRAMREAWLNMDEDIAADDPASGEDVEADWLFKALTLELAHPGGALRSKAISFQTPGLETLAILSGCWKEGPLQAWEVPADTAGGDAYSPVSLEAVLEQGGARLAAEWPTPRPKRFLRYPVDVGQAQAARAAIAPLEALFLRTPVEVRPGVANKLKSLQGILDSELYRLLDAIEATPGDGALLRAYARRASRALFRLVRDDPAFILQWPDSCLYGDQAGEHRMVELYRILSEPASLEDGASLERILFDRITSGIWSSRADKFLLLGMASTTPGLIPYGSLLPILRGSDAPKSITGALERLAHPEEHPAAQVMRDIVLLRMAAALKPGTVLPMAEGNLREILPGLFARVVAGHMGAPETDTLADHEAALLRIAGMTVTRLSAPMAVDNRAGLWLTYRLFQWIWHQLQAIPPDARRDGMQRLARRAPPMMQVDDLLNPFGFDRDRFDHRLASVLLALGVPLVTTKESEEPEGLRTDVPWTPTSPELEDHLRTIAERPGVCSALTTALEWPGPSTVPDLALLALLRLNQRAFALLSREARRRRLESLPPNPDELEGWAQQMPWLVLFSASDVADALDADERALMEQRVRAMAEGPVARRFRCTAFAGLFVTGAAHLEEDTRALVAEQVADPSGPTLFGRFLLGVARRDPARIEADVEAVLAAADARNADAAALLLGGLGQVAVHGPPAAKDVALDLLARLAQRPPFQENAHMQAAVRFFGLDNPKGEEA